MTRWAIATSTSTREQSRAVGGVRDVRFVVGRIEVLSVPASVNGLVVHEIVHDGPLTLGRERCYGYHPGRVS